MNWLDRIRAKYRWSYVGTAEAYCRWFNNGVESHTAYVFWSLYQRGDGKRSYKITGDPKWNDSGYVVQTQARVDVWKNGGPLPPLSFTAEPPKTKAKLFVFPGGKGDAA